MIVFTAIVSAYTTNIVLRDFLAIRRNEPQTYLSYSALCNKSRHCQAVLLTIVFHLYLLLTLITALQEIVHTLQDFTNAHKQLRLATKAQENQIGTATIGILLFPLTLLRSPKRYTWLVLVCMAGCVIGGLLLTNLLGNLKRSDQVYDSKPIDEIQVLVYISAGICNLIRAYGIHPILSLAINDMRDPEEAPRVIAIGFAVPTIFVVIVSMMSFLTFGGGIPPILFTAIDKAMTGNPSLFFHVSTTAVKSLLCFQLCFVYVLVMNTLNLCFEQSVLTTGKSSVVSFPLHKLFSFVPLALFPAPLALCPVPLALIPVPLALIPVPLALIPVPLALFPVPLALIPVPLALFPAPLALQSNCNVLPEYFLFQKITATVS